MSTFRSVFRFELTWQLRTPLFWSLCIFYFLVHFLTQSTNVIGIGGSNSLLNLNSPYRVLLNEAGLSYFGLMPVMVFLVSAITRDYDRRMAEFVFVQPLNRVQFLLGRFMGGFLTAVLVVFAGLIGNIFALFMPWLDPERLAPLTLLPQAYSFFFLTLPYVFIASACIFTVAALTRSASLSLAVAIIYVAINLTVAVYAGLNAPGWLGLADPAGAIAIGAETRYWSVAELNSQYPVGLLPLNRAIWLSFAFTVLAFACWSYRFDIQAQSLLPPSLFSINKSQPTPTLHFVRTTPDYGWHGQLNQLWRQLHLDLSTVLKNPLLYVVTALIMAAVLSEHGRFTDLLGMPMIPVTSLITGFFRFGVSPYAIILIMFFSGELVFRDREKVINEIISTSPYSDWIMPASKVLALCIMVTLLLFVAMLTSMALQTVAGYTNFEVGLYLYAMFVNNGLYFFMFAILAVLVQSLSPSKWVGMAVLTFATIAILSMPLFGLENVLYLLLHVPYATHSDIAGYGPLRDLVLSLNVYWGFLCIIIMLMATLFFPRGYYGTLSERLQDARSRVTRGSVMLSAMALLGFASMGSFIYYNTHVLNDYQTLSSVENKDAEYELTYGDYENRPAPNFTRIDSEIDIFPHERRVELRGEGTMVNLKPEPISEFVLSLRPGLQVNTLAVESATTLIADEGQGFYLYRLSEPLAPGTSVMVRWNITWHSQGFANSVHDVAVVENGTYIDGRQLLPAPGYRQDREITNPTVRRRYELGPADRLPKLGDPGYLDIINAGVSSRTSMNTVVSTSIDQIAVVPGSLIRDWTEGDRHYFEYRTAQAIWPSISISSGRFEVARDTWNDVSLEVYYDAKHPYNVQTMLDTAKLALDYYSEEFAPYNIPYFRIVEYPRYRSALTAFYGTVPYSEAVGFVARMEVMDFIDYGVLHELAHQWWGHLAYSAYMQGRMVLNETLAQYSTFMMYKEHASPSVLRYVLRYTLDGYLNGRSRETEEELPVMINENQGYISYNKGALALLYLQELIGSERMHLALRNYLDKYALQLPPFPTAKDLIDEIRTVAGPEYQQLITDLFEKIMFYEVAMNEVSSTPVNDGYEVTLKFNARQFEADGLGNDTEVPLGAWFDVVVFPDSETPLLEQDPIYQKMHFIESDDKLLTIHVNEVPGAAGIDPFHLMIDRTPGNNVAQIRE